MKSIIDNIAKLVDLKSIITILLVCTLIIIVLCNVEIKDEAIKTLFVSVVSSCFTYFFTKKKDNSSEV
jgi:glucan phosphoethanolaminetransferase (alkaline phosphatase superfamily)